MSMASHDLAEISTWLRIRITDSWKIVDVTDGTIKGTIRAIKGHLLQMTCGCSGHDTCKLMLLSTGRFVEAQVAHPSFLHGRFFRNALAILQFRVSSFQDFLECSVSLGPWVPEQVEKL